MADVSIERLTGQVRYLLEDQPGLRDDPAAIAERLDHDDRFARARERHGMLSDAEIASKAAELDARITVDHVRQALERVD